MTHEELEDVVSRHELDIADLRKQNGQLTASLKTFILSLPGAYTDMGEEATGQLRAQLICHFNDLRDRLCITDKSSPK